MVISEAAAAFHREIDEDRSARPLTCKNCGHDRDQHGHRVCSDSACDCDRWACRVNVFVEYDERALAWSWIDADGGREFICAERDEVEAKVRAIVESVGHRLEPDGHSTLRIVYSATGEASAY